MMFIRVCITRLIVSLVLAFLLMGACYAFTELAELSAEAWGQRCPTIDFCSADPNP